jgi:hypothetical protein
MNMFYQILAPFNSIILDISNALLGTVSENLGPMGKAVKDVVDWLNAAITYIKGEFSGEDGSFSKGFTAIWDKLVEGLGKLWEKIGPPITATWNNKVVPWLIEAFTNLFDLMSDVLIRHFTPGAETISETRDRKKSEDLLKIGQRADLGSAATAMQRTVTQEEFDRAKKYVELWEQHQKDRDKKEPNWWQKTAESESARFEQIKTEHPEMNLASGTLGTTGNLFADWGKETTVNLHGTESVVTPEQMGRIISGAGQNTLSADLKQLNTLTQQLLNYMKQTADNTRRTHDATRALSGNMLEAF